MFTSFARRLTGWYVVAATVLVVALALVVAFIALASYVRATQDTIDGDAREVASFSIRAAQRGERFADAAIEIEKRLARPGI